MAGYLHMSQTIARLIDEVLAADDIGKFVALAFDRPEDFIGSELEIAGSELNNRQAAEVFARVLGRPVKFRRLPMPIVGVALGKEFFQVFHWFNDTGYQADVKGLRARYPELQLRTLEDLAARGGLGRQARDRRSGVTSSACPLTQT